MQLRALTAGHGDQLQVETRSETGRTPTNPDVALAHEYVAASLPMTPTQIADPPKAAEELKNTVGVVEHGLFCGMTSAVIIAGKAGISVKTP